MEQIQADFHNSQDPDSTSWMLFGEGLEGCMHHMRFTLAHLEKHQKSLSERLSNDLNASPAAEQASFDKLHTEAKTLRRCLAFCSDVDAYVESQISNIENHAEGDDTIQFLVSTDSKRINGKNRGVGKRQKQAGGHFGEASLQQMSQDFKSIALYQSGHMDHEDRSSPLLPDETALLDSPKSPFHGRGFVLAKAPTSSCPADEL